MRSNLQHLTCAIRATRNLVAVVCGAVLVPGDTLGYALRAQQQPVPAATGGQATGQKPDQAPEQAPKIPHEQLDSLVAPIALYPDPMLAQTLAASTYPIELVELRQWLEQHKDLKDKALADAVKKEDWDPASRPWRRCRKWLKRGRQPSWGSGLGGVAASVTARLEGQGVSAAAAARIASAAVICRATSVAQAEAPWDAVPAGTADRAYDPAAPAAIPA